MKLCRVPLVFLFIFGIHTSATAGSKHKRQAAGQSKGACLTSPSREAGHCMTHRACTRILRNRKVSAHDKLGQGTCPRRRTCCPDESPPPVAQQGCGDQKNAFTPSILGGRAALEGEWPWMVSLSTGSGHECGAVLVTPRHVLTAAHCVIDNAGKTLAANRYTARLGLLDLRTKGEGQTVSVDKLTSHPSFNLSVFHADVAVLRLSKAVSLQDRKIGVVCLPDKASVSPLEGKYGAVAGWGDQKEGGNGSHTLQTLGSLPIWNRSRCSQAYRQVLTIGNGLFCAGFESGRRDSCQGDSGGPLMWFNPLNQRFSVVGIVSTGLGCGRRGFPGVYTDVLTYLPWIQQQLS